MSGHTPGPWRPSRHGPSDLTYGVEAGPQHDPVKVVTWGGIGRPSSVTGQANARLIAAAPELLEALQYVMSAHGEQLDDAFAQAHAAIRKATTGESA